LNKNDFWSYSRVRCLSTRKDHLSTEKAKIGLFGVFSVWNTREWCNPGIYTWCQILYTLILKPFTSGFLWKIAPRCGKIFPCWDIWFHFKIQYMVDLKKIKILKKNDFLTYSHVRCLSTRNYHLSAKKAKIGLLGASSLWNTREWCNPDIYTWCQILHTLILKPFTSGF